MIKKEAFKIALFGPQGSGKGTQAEMAAKKFQLPIVAPGEFFRREVKKRSSLGRIAAPFVREGRLVPDEIVNKAVARELSRGRYKGGFVLDGYPRDRTQLEFLEKKFGLTWAIQLGISDAEVVKRLGGRRVCRKCGAVYNLRTKPPKKNNLCDLCGDKLIVRADDKPGAIRKRLAIYHRKTEPIFNYYAKRKKLIKVNGARSVETVFKEIARRTKKSAP